VISGHITRLIQRKSALTARSDGPGLRSMGCVSACRSAATRRHTPARTARAEEAPARNHCFEEVFSAADITGSLTVAELSSFSSRTMGSVIAVCFGRNSPPVALKTQVVRSRSNRRRHTKYAQVNIYLFLAAVNVRTRAPAIDERLPVVPIAPAAPVAVHGFWQVMNWNVSVVPISIVSRTTK